MATGDNRINYEGYMPLYEKLLEHMPNLCMQGEIFQFALPAIDAGWDDVRDSCMYDFLDSIVPFRGSGFFRACDEKFSSVYRTWLNYLETVDLETVDLNTVNLKLADLKSYRVILQQCLKAVDDDTIEVYGEDGERSTRPRMELSGNLREDSIRWHSHKDQGALKENFLYIQPNAEYKYNIEVAGMACYDIIRGTWYNEALLTLQGLYPYVLCQYLSVVPVRVLIIYGMVIDMHIQIFYAREEDRTSEEPFVRPEYGTTILGVTSKIITPINGGNKNG